MYACQDCNRPTTMAAGLAVTLAIVAVLLILSSLSVSGSSDDGYVASVAYKLAVIDGDPNEEAAFQSAIDCIMAARTTGQTEQAVGDTLVSSWQHGSDETSLLAWAQVMCGG